MKKIAIVIIFLFLFLYLFSLFYLPASRITLKSNVSVKLSSVLPTKHGLFELKPLNDFTKIRKGFLSAVVYYNEPIIGGIKFSDGQFAITLKGRIINSNDYKGEYMLADMKSSDWCEEWSRLFYSIKSASACGYVREFLLFNSLPAFYDKNGILVIMGYGNYNDKILEYKKTMFVLKDKLDLIKEIDLEYEKEAVIRWREQ